MRRLSAEIQGILHEARGDMRGSLSEATGGDDPLEIVADAFRKLKTPKDGWPRITMNRFGTYSGTGFFPGATGDVAVHLAVDEDGDFYWSVSGKSDEGPSGFVPLSKRNQALQTVRKHIKRFAQESREGDGEVPCLSEDAGTDCWKLQEAVQFVAEDMSEATGLDPEVLSAVLVEAMSCESECRKKYVTEKGDFKGGKGEAFKTCEKYAEACCTGVKDPAAFCAYIGRKAGKI